MGDGFERELVRQAAAVRRLAGALVRDSSSADDVAQDTLQRAVTHAPQEGPLGGWLYRTLVNFTRQWRRGTRRRAAREAALVEPEPTATPLQNLVHKEALRNVTDAVLQLDEPYQTTILLRFFEDLPPREIAERTGTNVVTVKSRLQRGLAMLRERLDRKTKGEWRPALMLAFGLPALTGAAASAAATTVSTVSTGAWTTGLAALLLLGLGGMWWLGDDLGTTSTTAGTDTNPEVAATHAAANAAPTTDERPAAPLDRTVAIADPVLPSWLDHPFAMQLDVRVVDDLGLPVQGQSVGIGPVGVSPDGVTTDADGRTSMRWFARRPQVEVDVRQPNDTYRRVTVEHGRATALTMVAFPAAGRRPVRMQMLGEVPVLGQLFTNVTFGSPGSAVPPLHPFVRFREPCAAPIPTGDPWRGDQQQADRYLRVVGPLEFVPTVSTGGAARGDTAATARGAIDGLVLGIDGLPARALPVALLATGADVRRTSTDAEGHFVFAELPAGEFTVHAGGDDRGLATMPVKITDAPLPTTVLLQRGAAVHGRIEKLPDDAGGFVIEWRADDDSWSDAVATQADGTFALCNLPAMRGTLLVWQRGGALPIAVVRDVLSDNGEVRLRLQPTARRALRFTIRRSASDAVTAAPTALVRQLDTGIATVLHAPEGDHPWQLDALPPGQYEIFASAPGCGSSPPTPIWIDGTANVDAGTVALPPPGELRFDVAATTLPIADHQFELFVVRDDFDRVVLRGGDESLQPQFVPAGDYGLGYRDANGVLRFARALVAAGERTTLQAPETASPTHPR